MSGPLFGKFRGKIRLKNMHIDSTESSSGEVGRSRNPSDISTFLIAASLVALLIAPSIPSATLAIAVVAPIGVAVTLVRFQPFRKNSFKLPESAYKAFTTWGPYGDFWDIF